MAADSSPAAPRYTVPVRALCAFAAKSGDLDLRFTPAPSAADGVAGAPRGGGAARPGLAGRDGARRRLRRPAWCAAAPTASTSARRVVGRR
ncbi:MAG: hypothetical protein MZW92_28440 [Comamonadaceae bacterium]|nr:hypothetical protein [Comamonadaceae bacterium]